MVLHTYNDLYLPYFLVVEVLDVKATYTKSCATNFWWVRFDLRSLLQGRMWSLIPLMVYISFIIGRRGFGCEDNLWEIVC